MRLGQLLANEIADEVALAQKSQQGTLVMEADDLDLIAEMISIEPSTRRDQHSIPSPLLELMGQADSMAVQLLELEEMAAQGKRWRCQPYQGKRDKALRCQQPFRLNLDIREILPQMGNKERGTGVGPAGDQRQPWPSLPQLIGQRL